MRSPVRRLLVSWWILLVLAVPAGAQVVRDGSIGPPGPLAVPSGFDPNGDFADYLIAEDLGQRSGTSLYHSFDSFSISQSEVATFTGASDISVIVSRTTGALGSTILGVLRSTIDGAELFFLSPGGIVIGDGAMLDVPGSVHFSTATTLRFGPDASFDLPTDIATPPALLSMAPPSAFGFRDNPAGTNNRSRRGF